MEVSTGNDRDVMTKLIEDQSELVKWVNDQDGDLDLAVAFWGHDASAFLGLEKRGDECALCWRSAKVPRISRRCVSF